MPQNKQEQLLSLISKYSIGSEFVFEPDEYRKGNATREPADLVWYVNDCVVLIYMRYYQSGKGVKRNQLKSEKCSHHNLNQAQGWLKEWKGGRTLKGKNEHDSFAVPYENCKHILVLSIVDGKNCRGKSHIEFANQNDITCAGTLPQKVIEELVRHGASSIDIIHYLTRMVSNTTDHIEAKVGIDFVQNDFKAIIDKVDPDHMWMKGSKESYEYLSATMKALLHNDNGDTEGLADRLTDLPAMDYWVLVTCMLSQRQASIDNQKVLWSRINLPITGVHIVLASGSLSGNAENMKEILKLNDPIDNKVPSFMICWNFIGADLQNTMIAVNEFNETPYTQRFLDQYLTSKANRRINARLL
ncbi:hypothetical protein [Oceanicoccus sp. KOV_DT_Chl]|uniref:hypothetical protein n=1 Tax=Oceanicoccus sp. KOV_DT_Chl TaxID=1904639 RepID=UPI000C7DF753|nr:hypothetical protein [Oceanicoccus sp. KOV_DT_Chl]